MTTFITRLDGRDGRPDAPRLAVKDAIDVAGVPTTVGCAAVADDAAPADADAACLHGARAAGARIVGKTNLHELCFGATGVNPWYGTPLNPLDPSLIPGGSSSGSAVAVATGEADVAYGTDTAGSIRNPSACCGTVGLKTTWGRLPLDGIWPLAPSMDTVGPMARDVAGVVLGMQLLEPGFRPASRGAATVGRVRLAGTDPVVDAAMTAAIAATGLEVIDIDLPGWAAAHDAGLVVLLAEALAADRSVYERHRQRLGADVLARFDAGRRITAAALAEARVQRVAWRAELVAAFANVEVLVLPTMVTLPPPLVEHPTSPNPAVVPISLAGHPAIAQPVPTGGPLPASVQLVAPDGREDLLLATAAAVEAAAWS